MRLRYKAPSGGRTLELDDAATVSQLLEAIKQATGESEVTIKYGWPPQALSLDQPDTSLQSLGLQRESLTIIPAAKPSLDKIATPPAATGASAAGSEGALVARTQVAAWVVASTPGFVPGGSSELRGSTKLGKLGRPIACYSVAE